MEEEIQEAETNLEAVDDVLMEGDYQRGQKGKLMNVRKARYKQLQVLRRRQAEALRRKQQQAMIRIAKRKMIASKFQQGMQQQGFIDPYLKALSQQPSGEIMQQSGICYPTGGFLLPPSSDYWRRFKYRI